MRPALKKFSGVHVANGEIRRVIFEARDNVEATGLAVQWGIGIEGEVDSLPNNAVAPVPEAYDQQTARQLLGGISRTTLYAELATGQLERVPGLRRVLITRRSIERRCGRR